MYDAGKTKHAVRSAQLTSDMTAEDGRRAQMEVIAGVVQPCCDALLSANQLDATTQALRSVEADLYRARTCRAAGVAPATIIALARKFLGIIYRARKLGVSSN